MPVYPLTHAQKRIWYTEELFGHTSIACIAFTYRFPAPVSRDALEEAVNACLAANDSLRLRIVERPEEGGGLAVGQRVASHVRYSLEEHDFSDDVDGVRYPAWAQARASEPFPRLLDHPLYAFASVRLPGGESALFVKVHHIMADGQTMLLLPAQICACLEGRTLDVQPSYLEYVAEEQEYLESPAFDADRRFWLDAFSPPPDQPELSFRRSTAETVQAERLVLALPSGLRSELHAFASRRHSSAFKLLLSALAIHLSRVTRSEDVVVGTANHSRSSERRRATMGMFVSTLALRLRVDAEASFEALSEGVGRQVNDILKHHGRFPYDRLMTDLREKCGRSLSESRTIAIVGHPDLDVPLHMEHHFPGQQGMALVIHVNLYNRDHLGELELAYDYQVDLFEPQDIRALHDSLVTLLEQALADPLKATASLGVVSPAMRERLLVDFAGPVLELPENPTFVSLFEAQVERTPDALAVIAGEEQMTYGELDARANSLARALLARDVQGDGVVAIMAPPSLEMVVGLVGILKTGCAYMPIDPKYPADRIRYMLENSRARVLIGPADRTSDFHGTHLDLYGPELREGVEGRFAGWVIAGDPAFLIYTSGSTGRPKGALVEQRALVNMCLYYRGRVGLTPADRVAKAASFGFDATVLDIFPTLLAGASVWMVPEDARLSPLDLDAFFTRHGITTCFLTTQLGESFMELTDNRSLRLLVVGGEKLVRCPAQAYRTLNIYGPTEYTVFTTSCYVEGDRTRIPIGTPVANTRVYIMDPHDNLQPVGAPGELCISGASMARGYVGNPELTAQKFVDDPFVPGMRMYRTGDLARYLADGSLECLGRIDDQVKVRGYRIEPGEIESRILAYSGVRQAAVVAHPDSHGNKYLCGYLVADGAVDLAALKAFLATELPEYMVPPFLVPLDCMPVSPNGKIDRRALPPPSGTVDASVEHVPPATPVEAELVALWQEILEVDRVGVLDDFFALGGHSLKAATLQARLQKRMGVRLALHQIFAHPTVRRLAQLLAEQEAAAAVEALVSAGEIEPLGARDGYELSGAQKRLFVIQQMDRAGTTYNVPLLIRLTGPLDTRRLADAMDALVQRHESFRTSFEMVDGRPLQRIHASVKLRKEQRELSERDLAGAVREFVRPFDLGRAPLVRTCLLHTGPESHVLLVDIHHIVFDGISLAVMVRELGELYAGRELPPVRVQYKEFAAWQNRRLEGDAARRDREFWVREFQDDVPVLELPTDHPRPSVLDYRGNLVSLALDSGLSEDVRQSCARHGVTVHAMLMAAFGVLLARYTGQEDVVIGTPVAGRTHPDVADTVGFFVNTLPIRMRPADGQSFRDLLVDVRGTLLEAIDHQEYPLERLVEDLRIRRDASRNPMMDAVLVFQNDGYVGADVDGLHITVEPALYDTAKFDILLEVIDQGGPFTCQWNYRSSLFDGETLERMHGHLSSILRCVTLDASRRVADVALLSRAEERTLLETYNQTNAAWPREATIHGLFEKQVARVPDHVAVTFRESHLTYRELNERANRLARLLRDRGVGRDSIVGMLLDRSLEMLVGIMAILKAGGCYLPINPDHPADRIQYTLENSGTPWLLTTRSHLDVPFTGERIFMDDDSAWRGLDGSNLENVTVPGDLAYIIYTSGSTGRPKGVMIDHHNVVRLLHNDALKFTFGPDDVWTMFHSYCFDFSVWEMYGALLYGGRLVVVPRSAALSPAEFLVLLKSERVTVLNQTPGAFYNLIAEDLATPDHDLRLRYVVFGGEALKPIMLRAWHAKYPDTLLVNMYGITETTVHVTFKVVTQEEIDTNRSNIGLPIPTLTCYLMDRNQHLVPVGVAGEICVGGEGVARGYLGMQELTARRFIVNPYRPSERLYRSGDLARRLPDGEMEYFGRLDFQVKVRGFRVELGEIENQLLRNPAVEKGVVLAVDDVDGGKSLAAYLVMREDQTVAQLREYLARELPDYMIPSWFVKLDELPLTSNGKVDRRALPDPHVAIDTGSEFAEPRNDAERAIARAWAKVLGLERVGIHDNFFALGGHSLKAVALAAELQKGFTVTVNDLFEHQTVAELAERLKPHEHNLRARLSDVREHVLARIAAAADSADPPEMMAARADYERRTAGLIEQALVGAAAAAAVGDAPVLASAACANRGTVAAARDVLLTGATGYLGIYMLRDLLSEGSCFVRTIVRAASDDEARARVKARLELYFGSELYEQGASRLEVRCGDLAHPRLGLSEAAWEELAREVDCIVHTAANVRHYGHYDEFHAANVLATNHLLELAGVGRPKRFHHVSTASVAYGEVEGRSRVLFTEDDCDVGQRPANYYVKTKLEAEKAVLEARRRGVAASVYRVGNIAFDSCTGHFQGNIEENAFYRLVKASVNLGVVPEVDDEFECSFVDQVSRSILLLMGRRELDGQTWHIVSPHVVKMSEVLTDPRLGLGVRRVAFGDFIDYLVDHHDREEFRESIEDIMLHKGWLSDDFDAGTRYTVLSARTVDVLARLGFTWPAVEPLTMRRMIVEGLRQRIDFLGGVSLFSAVSRANRETLACRGHLRVVEEGTDLLWEGHASDSLYVIVRGEMEISRHSASGWLGLISVLGPGEFLGESGVLGARESPVTAEAVLDDAVVFSLPRDAVEPLLTSSPAFVHAFLSQMATRIRKLETLLVDMG